MKTIFYQLLPAVLFYSFCFLFQTNLTAQNSNLLYGVTGAGGNDGAGVIFHFDRTTSEQTVDYTFPVMIKGKSPHGNLTYGGNGKFYGMTASGGTLNMGLIFEWDSATNSITSKYEFNYTDGYSPYSSLTYFNGKFYGMTPNGGVNSYGVIFEWDPITNIYSKKVDFDGVTKGARPYGSLTLYNGKFYRMTQQGGIGYGVIFEWDPVTNIFTKKSNFNSNLNGASPEGSLTFYNGKFYGMTTSGGVNYTAGVIFEWDPITNIYLKKVDFDGTLKGRRPKGSLTLKDGKLYGMTETGGTNDLGVIFEWDPVMDIFEKKINFTGSPHGSNPYGDLTLYNGKLYGMTFIGGLASCGEIFERDPSTNVFSERINFVGSSNGRNPTGSLIVHNGKMLGMTFAGGKNAYGVIFEWDPATNLYNKKIDFFSSAFGTCPYGSLTLLNGKFYGMTFNGSEGANGVIFEWNPSTGSYVKRVELTGTFYSGGNPYGSLSYWNGKFYGMTFAGGAYGLGVIFEWDPSTDYITNKINFDGSNYGSSPIGTLIQRNGKFYGTTIGGGYNGRGVIFEWNPLTNAIIKKIEFTNEIDGSTPTDQLVELNGKFYGMTNKGGTSNYGVIFEWDPVSNVYAKKFDFSGGASTGCQPNGSMNMFNGKCYGMTAYGGLNNMGVIFEYDPNTNIYNKKLDFDGTIKGNKPQGTLTLSNGKFYGLTSYGGTYNYGVSFEWNPIDNSFNKIHDFNVYDGSIPFFTQLGVYNDSITTAQATNIDFISLQNNQMTVNWVDGSGAKRAVFIKQGNNGTVAPINHTAYTANTNFGSGTQVGSTGWYCVFNGTAHNNGVSVTNLIPGNDYRVMVCEYTGVPGAEQYNDSTADGNPANQTAGYFYTITTSSVPVSGGNTTGDGSYIYGSQATISANPNAGFDFVNWTENSSVVSTSTSYSFVVNANRNLKANFAQQQFIISTSSAPTAGGTTSGSGTYNYSTPVTVTAIANSNWTFLNWTENGNVVSTIPAYSFTVNSNRSLVANFTQLPTFLITTASSPADGGATAGGGNYYSGQSATVTATANTGYNFTNWTENGNVVSTNPSYSFTVSVAKNLVANFQLQQFNITTSSNPPTGGITSGDGTFNYGVQAMVTAIPNSNWNFANWTENGVIVSLSQAYSFYVNSNRVLVANFTATPTFLVTTSSSPFTGGETTGGGSFYIGQMATVTATANTGYDFTNWTENGNIVSTEANYSFTVSGARYLVANFMLQQFTISTSANPVNGGTTSGGGTYAYGGQVTLNATANSNWTFLNWTENGNIVSTSPEFVFTVNSNQSYAANFTQLPTYQVTTTSFPFNGGITSGGGNYITGQQATVSAMSNTGYSFTNWTENGNIITVYSIYSFTVTGNRNMVANFEPQDFMITANAIPAGSGTTTGSGMYPYGSTATVTAVSGKSWAFYEWTENCNPVSTNSIYSFVVNSSRDLAAVFYQPGIQYVTSTIASPPEGGYTTGCGTYHVDSLATVHAIAYPGWEFEKWTEAGSMVSVNPDYSYQVSDHRSLTASFRLFNRITEMSKALARVYPNPSRDKVYVEWDNSVLQLFDEVTIFNSLSQEVYFQKTSNLQGRLVVDVKAYKAGVYLLVLQMQGRKVADFKVVVQPY